MYYFFMKRNFNLSHYDFDVLINPRLTKKEQEILNIFLDYSEKEKKYTEIQYDFKLFKVTYDDLIEIIDKIKKKSISIKMKSEDNQSRVLFINFFEIIFFEDNKIVYKLGREFSIAKTRDNFFSRINLLAVLKFRNIHFYSFLKLILKYYEFKKEIIFELNLDELKEYLSIPKDKYTRFYDLESRVLKPLLSDLNKMNLPTYIEKIKSSKGKGSKITGIRVKFINLLFIELDNDTNNFLRKFAENIDNFVNAYDNIFLYRKTHTSEETEEYIKENIENISKKDFVG